MTPTHELSPGIPHRLNDSVVRIVAPNGGPMTGAGTNTYLVGTDQLVLIDPGPDVDSHVAAIVGAGGGRIRWILCTHTHEDHAPAAVRLRGMLGVPVCGMSSPATDHDSRLEVDRTMAEGDVVGASGAQLRAVHTPGHASNHLCFLLESHGMLFTGDHIMQGSTVVIWPPDGNMRSYIESLRKLFSLELRVLAPGHGRLIDDPRGEVERLIQHRLRREEKVRRAVSKVGAAGATVQDLLPGAYDDVPTTLHRMAALSLQAHLQKLVEDGELSLGDDERFRPRETQLGG